jgi:hypothetical protein
VIYVAVVSTSFLVLDAKGGVKFIFIIVGFGLGLK